MKRGCVSILLLSVIMVAFAYGDLAASSEPNKILVGGSDPVNCLAFTKDGTRLLSGNGASLTLWDVEAKSILNRQKQVCPNLINSQTMNVVAGEVSSVGFNHDDTIVASSCSTSGDVRISDISMKELKKLSVAGTTNCVMFSRDGESLASAGASVLLWDTHSWNRIGELAGHTASINALAFSHSGKRLASGSSDRTVKIWDLPSRRIVQTLDARSRAVVSIAVSKDGEVLVSGGNFPNILFWNVKNGVMTKALPTLQNSMVKAVTLDQGQRIMASAYANGVIDVWDFPSGIRRMTFSHGDSVNALVFSPDGKTLVSGGGDGKIKFWDISSEYSSQGTLPAGGP